MRDEPGWSLATRVGRALACAIAVAALMLLGSAGSLPFVADAHGQESHDAGKGTHSGAHESGGPSRDDQHGGGSKGVAGKIFRGGKEKSASSSHDSGSHDMGGEADAAHSGAKGRPAARGGVHGSGVDEKILHSGGEHDKSADEPEEGQHKGGETQ